MAVLKTYFNDNLLHELEIKNGVVTIGRKSTNDIMVDNMAVSSFHAQVVSRDEGFFVEDNKSTNGTFVNGAQIDGQCKLENGDIITICKHHINFVVTEREAVVHTAKSVRNTIEPLETVIFDQNKMKEILREHKMDAAVSQGKGTAWLIVTSGNKANHSNIELNDDDIIKIGRDVNSDVRIPGWFGPKLHAIIHQSSNGYIMTPQSRVKIIVNGKSIRSAVKLKNHDHIRVKNVNIKFHVSLNANPQ